MPVEIVSSAQKSSRVTAGSGLRELELSAPCQYTQGIRHDRVVARSKVGWELELKRDKVCAQ